MVEDTTTEKPVETDEKGIPIKSPYPEKVSVVMLYSGMTVVIGGIGVAIAYVSSYLSESKRSDADVKISILSEHNLGWLYAGLFLLKLLQLPININLGQARNRSKLNVPDQHCYKVMGAAGSKLGYVLMESDGDHGAFNRAQRALQNYNEQFPAIALQYVAASFVFPFESFVCAVIWALSSCSSAVGYTA